MSPDTIIAVIICWLTTCIFILCAEENLDNYKIRLTRQALLSAEKAALEMRNSEEEVSEIKKDLSHDLQTNEDIKQLANKPDNLVDTNTLESLIFFFWIIITTQYLLGYLPA